MAAILSVKKCTPNDSTRWGALVDTTSGTGGAADIFGWFGKASKVADAFSQTVPGLKELAELSSQGLSGLSLVGMPYNLDEAKKAAQKFERGSLRTWTALVSTCSDLVVSIHRLASAVFPTCIPAGLSPWMDRVDFGSDVASAVTLGYDYQEKNKMVEYLNAAGAQISNLPPEVSTNFLRVGLKEQVTNIFLKAVKLLTGISLQVLKFIKTERVSPQWRAVVALVGATCAVARAFRTKNASFSKLELEFRTA